MILKEIALNFFSFKILCQSLPALPLKFQRERDYHVDKKMARKV